MENDSIQIAASKLKKLYSAENLKKATHPPLLFNNNNVSQVNSQKHLGVILDVKLTKQTTYLTKQTKQ